jgi:hypothetical protein
VTELYEYKIEIYEKLENCKFIDKELIKKIKNLIPEIFKDETNRRVISFLSQILVGFIAYVFAIFNGWKQIQGDAQSINNFQIPTLLYALLIIWVLTLFIGSITFIFDRSIDKVLDNQKTNIKDKETVEKSKLLNHTFYWPVILLLILFSASAYGAGNVDHVFKLLDPPTNSNELITNDQYDPQKYKQDFQQAIWNRLCFDKDKKPTCNNKEDKYLVVVAASGGGIQASGWMTQVLAGLQDETSGIGEDFTKAIGLISSASGGSVGSMFYLNQFENGVLVNQSLKKDENELSKNKYALSKIVKNATDDWLNSVGWGLAFPDLFRVIGLPCIPKLFFNELGGDEKQGPYVDRGYALEKNWEKTLTVGGKKPPTLDERREQILKGEIPIPVYNTTLVENGRPFFVSPMKFVPGIMADYANESSGKTIDNTALDFKTLYNNCGTNGDQPCDLALTTAARLSASFPYVTPMARNDRENIIEPTFRSSEQKKR